MKLDTLIGINFLCRYSKFLYLKVCSMYIYIIHVSELVVCESAHTILTYYNYLRKKVKTDFLHFYFRRDCFFLLTDKTSPPNMHVAIFKLQSQLCRFFFEKYFIVNFPFESIIKLFENGKGGPDFLAHLLIGTLLSIFFGIIRSHYRHQIESHIVNAINVPISKCAKRSGVSINNPIFILSNFFLLLFMRYYD